MIASAIRLEVIENGKELDHFREEWRQFERERPPETPFQTTEWLLTWWPHFGSELLRILVFRCGSRIAGVLPGFIHRWKGRRQFTLIGTGISDYLDPPFDSRFSGGIVEALRWYLAESREWDLCDWQGLSADSPLLTLGAVHDDTACSELEIEGTFEKFLEGRPKRLRRKLRQFDEKGALLGDLDFGVSSEAEPELVESLIRLHSSRWRESGEAGMIAANHSATFLRDVSQALARQNMLRFFTIRLDGKIAAVLIALRKGLTIFGYLTAFDPEFRRYGFGSELLARSLQYAQTNGYRWNFLRGEEPYKFDWGATLIPKRRVLLER